MVTALALGRIATSLHTRWLGNDHINMAAALALGRILISHR